MFNDADLEMKGLVEQLAKTLGILDEELLATVVGNATLMLGEECPSPDKRAIRASMEGLALKFRVHNFPGQADALEAGVAGLVGDSQSYASTTDLPWNLLKLVLGLSWRPLAHAQQGAAPPPLAAPLDHSSGTADAFDWPAHLMEGGRQFGGVEGDESESDWSQLSDEEEATEPELPPAELELPTSRQPDRAATLATRTSSVWALRSKQVSSEAELLPAPTQPLGAFRYTNPFLAPSTGFMRLGSLPSDQVSSASDRDSDRDSAGERETAAHSASQTEILRCYRQGFEAERRLNAVVQDCDWFSARNLTARPGKPTAPEAGAKITVLTEYQVLREVLWMFLAPNSMRCFGLDETGLFKPRPDFTVKDVSADTLWHYLVSLCPHYDALRELEQFHADLYDEETAPVTYKEYYSGVGRYLAAFRRQVGEIIDRVAKQDSITTLISVRRELQPSLHQLTLIAEIHARAVCDWREKPYWLSSMRLLSVLYQMLIEESTPSKAAILLDLLVCSFHAYARIMDSALGQGLLVDPLNEFIVYSDSDVDSSMHASWENGFYLQPYAACLGRLPPLPFLHALTPQLLVCCKTMHLVHKLGRLTYIQDLAEEESLYWGFLRILETEYAKYVRPGDLIPVPVPEPKKVLEPVFRKTGKANPMAGLLVNPLLREAFREFIELEDEQDVTPPEEKKPDPRDEACERLKRYAGSALLPHEVVLGDALGALVNARYLALGQVMNRVMGEDVKLWTHLRTVRAVYMLEAGDVAAVFQDSLMQKEKDEPHWQYSHYLTSHLEEYLALRSPGVDRFRVTVGEEFLRDNLLDAVEGITLNYTVDWPLCLIISRRNRLLYNDIFRQLLKQKLALSSLERLRHSDLLPGDARQADRSSVQARVARWQLLRFYLMNAVRAVHGFTMNHIVYWLNAGFDRQLKQADDFDSLIDAHDSYVRSVHRMCVNPFSDARLKALLDSLLVLSQSVGEFWQQGSFVALDTTLAGLEQTYCAMHVGIRDSLKDFNPKESGIQMESLLLEFSYPLNARYQDICRQSGVV